MTKGSGGKVGAPSAARSQSANKSQTYQPTREHSQQLEQVKTKKVDRHARQIFSKDGGTPFVVFPSYLAFDPKIPGSVRSVG
jgi:hypothetical protein